MICSEFLELIGCIVSQSLAMANRDDLPVYAGLTSSAPVQERLSYANRSSCFGCKSSMNSVKCSQQNDQHSLTIDFPELPRICSLGCG